MDNKLIGRSLDCLYENTKHLENLMDIFVGNLSKLDEKDKKTLTRELNKLDRVQKMLDKVKQWTE